MKGTFKAFHNVDAEDLKASWVSSNTIFVFDTNVLLNLYGYAKQTRDDFFKLIDKIGDGVWIPYQVGLEYQRRRLDVIKNEKVVFNEIEKNLQKIQNVFKDDFEKLSLKRRFPKLSESTEKLEAEISKSISNYKKSVAHWNSEQPCVRSHDEIRDLLNDYFEGKVGEKPSSQAWLDDLYVEGSERYKNKIPPGFKDSGKSKDGEGAHFFFDGLSFEKQYGDLILWKQLLEKSSSQEVENVIFVTDDSKEDWWYKIHSNGEKTIGPLAELQAEIYRESGIKKFHMYSTSSFMEDGKANLSVVVNESSIEDAGIQHIQAALDRETVGSVQKILKDFENSKIQNKRIQTLLGSYHDPFGENEKLQKLLGTHHDPFGDNEKLRKLLGTHHDPFGESEKLKNILGSYRDPLSDSEKLKKSLSSYNDSIGDDETLKKILYSDENTLDELERKQRILREIERNSEEDDLNDE